MKTSTASKFLAAAFAGLGLLNTAKADVTVVISGGNATENVLWEVATNVLSGYTVTNLPGNSNVRSFLNGTLNGHPELGIVTLHTILNGAIGGIQDLQAQNNDTTANGLTLPPTVADSGTSPQAVGIDPTPFTQEQTLIVPFVYTRNAKWTDIATITNLTERQATYLEGAAGSLPTTYFGGTNGNANIYLVGRDLSSAVRTEIDANIFFNGTLSSWTTNSLIFQTNAALNAENGNVYTNSPIGAIVPDPGTTFPGYPGNTSLVNYGPGQNGGSQVDNLLAVVTNSIGTVSSANISTNVALSYEGVAFSTNTVENGSYPIWNAERWLTLTSGSAAPSANQQTVIAALYNYITAYGYQHPPTNNQFTKGLFVPIADLQVTRSADGGPITSTLY